MTATSSEFLIEEFAHVVRAPLVSFVRVRLPSGMIIHRVGVYRNDGREWAMPHGKLRLAPVIEFTTSKARDQFSTGVVDAVRLARPDLFGEAPT